MTVGSCKGEAWLCECGDHALIVPSEEADTTNVREGSEEAYMALWE